MDLPLSILSNANGVDQGSSADNMDTGRGRSEGTEELSPLLGEFLALAISSGVRRSMMGHSDRMKLLAEGSSFQTYRSSIRETDADGNMVATPVAIKMLRGNPFRTDARHFPYKAEYRKEQLQGLIREIRVLGLGGSLRHKNIVTLLEWGFSTTGRSSRQPEDPAWQEIQPYLVLELADQHTLQHFFHSAECFSSARGLALDIVSGLEYLHRIGVVHGDLKLENILIFKHQDGKFTAKISDFSHCIHQGSTSQYLGTDKCLPPEVRESEGSQFLNFEQLTTCDLWAFGVCAFELITSSGCDAGLIQTELKFEDPEISDKLNPALSTLPDSEKTMWEDVLAGSLRYDPELRKSANQIKRLLSKDNDSENEHTDLEKTLKYPTVLEIMANYSIMDEKYHIQKWLTEESVYGPESLRCHYCFQVAQGHYLGFGFKPDTSKAMIGMIFACTKEDPIPSDPICASVLDRVLGQTLDGNAPPVVYRCIEILKNASDEEYYSKRIALYRHLGNNELQSSTFFLDPSNSQRTYDDLLKSLDDNPSGKLQQFRLSKEPLDYVGSQKLSLSHAACLIGDLASLKKIMKFEPESGGENTRSSTDTDSEGNSLLHYACMGGHRNIAIYLSEHSPQLNTANSKGTTPLHWLPFFSDQDILPVARLLGDPEIINSESSGVKIPIHFLYLRGTPLHWAVSCRNLRAVKTLLDVGADIDKEYDGCTPLALAVEMHAFDTVEVLLQRGATYTNIGPHKRSALHFIAGDASILRRQCIHGKSTLRPAAMDTIQVLESYGCDLNSLDVHGNTALHKAVASPLERGNLYVIEALMLSGADRNIQNCNGDSVLHLTVKLSWVDSPEHKSILQLLMDDEFAFLDTPLQTSLRDNDGRTPIFIGGMLSQDVTKFIPWTREEVLATDNSGKSFLDLANTSIRDMFIYMQHAIQDLKQLGLGVSRHPDCS